MKVGKKDWELKNDKMSDVGRYQYSKEIYQYWFENLLNQFVNNLPYDIDI